MPNSKESLVLAISGSEEVQIALEELLERAEFKLVIREDPDGAANAAHDLLPDAILLDWEEEAGSLEICRRLRSDRQLKAASLIVMVETGNRKAKAQALAAGADDFINKPFDALEVLARLRTLTRLRHYDRMLSELERFKWMTHHAQEGYLLLDEVFTIQYANERAINMLNLPEDPLGLDFIEAAQANYVARPQETWQAWPTDPSPCFLMRPENVNARAFWMVLESLDTSIGAESQRIVRLRDVTEKMSIYHDVRRFHDTITHKLRTPVSLLATSVSLINSQLERLSDEEIRELMKTAGQGAERLVWQVRDVLTYIDAPLSINLGEPVALAQIHEMAANIKERFGIRQVSLSMPEHMAETRIPLTPDALELILSEALENSKKFHPESMPVVEIKISQIGLEQVEIQIADNGVTLSAEQLAWAWLPYFQGEKAFTGELPGMGLGFPLMATIIWGAGGSLRFNNRTDGPGVKISMRLPVARQET